MNTDAWARLSDSTLPQFTALSRNGAAAQSNAFADSNRNAHELTHIDEMYLTPRVCDSKTHQTHTFRLFAGRDSGVQHCVYNLVKEHSCCCLHIWISINFKTNVCR